MEGEAILDANPSGGRTCVDSPGFSRPRVSMVEHGDGPRAGRQLRGGPHLLVFAIDPRPAVPAGVIVIPCRCLPILRVWVERWGLAYLRFCCGVKRRCAGWVLWWFVGLEDGAEVALLRKAPHPHRRVSERSGR